MTAGPSFFQTIMGRQFYEATMPEIARQLKRVADALEKQAVQPAPVPVVTVPANPPSSRYVLQTLEMSTGHVAEETAKYLDEMDGGFWVTSNVAPYDTEAWVAVYKRGEYGWFIGVPTEPGSAERWKVPDNAKSLLPILKYCREHNIRWILMDSDADEVPGFQLYDW